MGVLITSELRQRLMRYMERLQRGLTALQERCDIRAVRAADDALQAILVRLEQEVIEVKQQAELHHGIRAELTAQLVEVITRRLIGVGDVKALERDEWALRSKLAELLEGRCCAC